MIGMILAAGRGTRMGPSDCPKPLTKVGPHRLIEYRILAFVEAGITDIVINVHHMADMIQATLGDGSAYGARLRYSVEETLLNTGGGIRAALPLLGEDPFIVVNADVWTDYPFDTLARREPCLAHLVLVQNPVHNLDGDFALDHGLIRMEGSPRYTFAGISYLHPDFFNDCPEEPFGLGFWLQDQANHALVTGEVYSGLWMDAGTRERLAQIEALNRKN